MYKHLVIVIGLTSLCCFMIGILNIVWYIEPNSCKMTYMYQLPTFIKVDVPDNELYPKYNLYTYAEGSLIEKARSMKFYGAPVIFVPGSSGSYKQGRSLASTALRKGLDNDMFYHLDYFLVDFNEELSAIFGGYIENQKAYLRLCITSVLNLYKKLPNAPKEVIIVGHSMGGKIAQMLLTDPVIAKMINSIIAIAAPLDNPVVKIDFYMDAAYRKTEAYLIEERHRLLVRNTTNCCVSTPADNLPMTTKEDYKSLDNKLLISIGGGNRDLMVRAGLTYSKYSDINVVASAIPFVWASIDHRASVWCLQLVLTINRFLFSIIYSSPASKPMNGLHFIENKSVRLKKALQYFTVPSAFYNQHVIKLKSDSEFQEWFEDSRRVFTKDFKSGLNYTYFQMIPLIKKTQYQMLYAEIINLDGEDWLYGCGAKEFGNAMRQCSYAEPLFQYIEKIPNNPKRKTSTSIDLHTIKEAHPSWTHVVIRIPPTRNYVKLNIDVHDAEERTLKVRTPRWFSYTEKVLLTDTVLGASYYKIQITDLDESHQSLQFNIKPRVCSRSSNNAIAKTCIPWSKGYERYQNFSEPENQALLVNVPISKPLGYNSTKNPVTVFLYLDPHCRYEISYRSAFGNTMARIVHQYWHWLLSHLATILFLSFKYQVSVTPAGAAFKCGKLHSALVNCGSFFIITVSRIFSKMMQSISIFPEPDNFHQSLIVSFILHGATLSCLIFATVGCWSLITLNGHIIHGIFLRMTKLTTPVFAIILPIIERVPLMVGIILIGIAFASCGGIALILGCLIYFMLIAKEYENYLEQFIFKTMADIAKKLFGKNMEHPNAPEAADTSDKNEEVGETAENRETAPEILNQEGDQGTPIEASGEGSSLESNTQDDDKSDDKALVPHENHEITDETEGQNDDQDVDQDEELKRLLNEAIKKQEDLLLEKQEQKKIQMHEYESVHQGLSVVHFHMTLLFLMSLLAILFIPSTLVWAKDFKYYTRLSPDPSIIPATVVLSCVFILWEISAPRNIYAYQFVATIAYTCAAICIVYCQDSVYRLSGVIPTFFIIVTLHQMFSSVKPHKNYAIPTEVELKTRIEKMKEVLAAAETNFKDPKIKNEET